MQSKPIVHEVYAGQFDVVADPLTIAIPRDEIIAQMVTAGEAETLDRVCVSVAVVLDALTSASLAAV